MMDSWFYEKFLDDIEYMPNENYFLDVWLHEVKVVLADYRSR